MGVLQVGMVDVGTQLLYSSEEAGSWEFPPDSTVSGVEFMITVCLTCPTHFSVGDMGIFSFAQSVGVTQPGSAFLSE